MDMLFQVVGAPQTLSAVVTSQFPTITLNETEETFPNKTPDQVVVIGTLANGPFLLRSPDRKTPKRFASTPTSGQILAVQTERPGDQAEEPPKNH
jgi:hypothetical protein